jgi:hypothetical protein
MASTIWEAHRVTTERHRQDVQSEPLIVNLRTAAVMLGGVGTAKMKRLGRSGELVLVMIGPHHYFTTASVRAFAQRGEAPRPEHRATRSARSARSRATSC